MSHINDDDILVIRKAHRFFIESDKDLGSLHIPILSIRLFTYKFDYYDGFPFEKSWLSFQIIANLSNPFDENLAEDMFMKHIYNGYQKSYPIRKYEKSNYFLNKDKWFHYFHNLAEFQVLQLLEKQKFIFQLNMQTKALPSEFISYIKNNEYD